MKNTLENTAAPQTAAAETPKAPKNNPLTLKIVFIGIIMLILLIPGGMIMALISERQEMMQGAQDEVARMWSGEQHLTGPVITLPYTYTITDNSGKVSTVRDRLTILPERLDIAGNVVCRQLRRGLYDTNVYNSEITFTGTFACLPELKALQNKGIRIDTESATVAVGISDLRGIEESIRIDWNGESLPTHTESENNCFEVGVAAEITPGAWPDAQGESIPFEIKMKLKGSAALYFAPVGNQTSIRLSSDCPTPSFAGNFLPSTREVTETGFTAEWKVVAQNRNYAQLITGEDYKNQHAISQSEVGVNLLVPVTQYQQTTRSIKYAVLIILLTFIGVLFVEMTQHKNIHAFQYLLVGLALILFYSLLVSISEHLGFGLSYLIAAAMTTTLITAYIYGVVRIGSTALCIGALLAILYTYVYVLLQLETYALLSGSVGLFVILAAVMRYSLKMEWTGSREKTA